ncbi:fatty acid synthase-like [Brevipalpus obovatus]|uniref:fatty acid synthase-like n=1 Tax=Brevipalpus obovatus TaxID=246614 RepID=UPI003D9EEAA9
MPWTLNEEIVISGISGRFPEADHVEELWDKLMNGIPLYTKDGRRWPVNLINLPPNSGKIKDIGKFDAEMFGIDPSSAHDMDPQMRLLHEVTYETLWDAGYNPNDLRGSRTGFYVGSCYDDTLAAWREDDSKLRPYFSFPSRISYAMDWHGPVVQIDTACASSFSCFMEGLTAINAGVCDRCIIAGLAIQLRPAITNAFFQLKMLSPDGTSKCLDANADGYCRSEAVVALFLERKSMARRIYGNVLNCRTNCDGYKQEGITYPGFETQYALLEEVYSTTPQVSPLDINYVEAHITGTQAGDPVESNAIIKTLRPNGSTKPIKFGCLKSSIGHSEGASALCSLTKVSKIFQSGYIPPNLNYSSPNPKIKPLMDGIIEPVTKITPFREQLIAVNSFGFGGVNVHAIIGANEKHNTDDSFRLTMNADRSGQLPRLVNACNRTEEGIQKMFNYFEKNRNEVSREFLKLIHEVCKVYPEQGMKARGFVVMNDSSILRQSITSVHKTRPLWLVLNMPLSDCKEEANFAIIQTLRQFKPCVHVLDDCSQVLTKRMNMDMDKLFNGSQNDLIASTMCAAIKRLALLGLYKSLKIKFNRILGLSMGELLAGFANDVMSVEQILTGFYVVAKTIQDSKTLNNGFVGLTLPMLAAIKPKLMVELSKIFSQISIKSDRKSAQQSKSNAGIELFIDSLVHGDYETSSQEVPEDAQIITFGPEVSLDGLEMSEETSESVISMTFDSDQKSDLATSILTSIGHMYCSGQNPDIEQLYPPVEYPVPRETPTLSHFLQWDHSNSWKIAKYPEYHDFIRSLNSYTIDIVSPDYRYMEDHCIDGRVLFPATGYLYLTWDYVAHLNGRTSESVPIIFRNVKLHRAVMLSKDTPARMNIQINQHTHQFQVTEGNSIVVDGLVELASGPVPDYNALMKDTSGGENNIILKTKDIYKDLRLRGYDYGPNFQNLVEARSNGSWGRVKYADQWVSFADSMLQVAIFGEKARQLYLPTFIEYMRCDPDVLQEAISTSKQDSGESLLEVHFNRNGRIGATKGLVLSGLKASAAPRRISAQNLLLEDYQYVAYDADLVESVEKQKKLEQYISMNRECLEKIDDPSKKVDKEESIQELIERGYEQHTLLRTIYEAVGKTKEEEGQEGQQSNDSEQPKEGKEILIEKLNEAKYSISRDILLAEAIEETIYDQISVVAENTAIKNIVVTELNETYGNLFESISDNLNSLGIRSKVNLVHPDPDVVEKITRAKVISSPIDSKTLALSEPSDLIIIKDHRLMPLSNQFVDSTRSVDWDEVFTCASKNLKSGGFILCCYREWSHPIEEKLSSLLQLAPIDFSDLKSITENLDKHGLLMISQNRMKSCGLVSILLRKTRLPDESTVIELTDTFEWIGPLKEALASVVDQRVWLVATKSPLIGVVGMVNCLRREPKGDRIRCLYDAGNNNLSTLELTQEMREKDLVFNVYKSNQLGSYRHHRIDPNQKIMTQAKNVYLDAQTRGDLSSLRWFRSIHDCWARLPEKIFQQTVKLVNVYYGALNFKDVMVASGRIPVDAYPSILLTDCLIGMEYSGIDQDGRRIMGIVDSRAIATTLIWQHEYFTFDVPDHWSLRDAATVPVVYVTVYYALFLRGNLQPGEKILIHAGSGGVGQAAISICLRRGCEVFATVGTKEKREFLKKTFPQLDDEHIGNSRSTEFEEMILKATNGRGVDMVLNSLSEDKFRASVRCLADYGRFIEIGKYDLVTNSQLEESILDGNKTYHAVCVAHLQDDVFNKKTQSAIQMKETIEYLMKKGIANGEVRPLSSSVFDMNQTEEAFRFMATGKHIGKVLIQIRDESDSPTNSKLYPCIAQTVFDWNKVYIITGGLGGVGLELASWLIERGATKLVLTSRNGPKEPYQLMALERLRRGRFMEITIQVSKNDGQSYASVASLLEEANTLAPIGGIFHLAMVLNDAIFENQTEETFNKVCGPKIRTTKYLDSLSRKMCPELDFFVCFSSVASGKGNPGQTNYAFANSFMERICERRRLEGLPGVAVQWGAIGDVGVVAEQYGGNQVVLGGTLPQRIPSCMEVLDKFLQASHSTSLTVGSSIVLADSKKSSGIGKENLLRSICHVIGVKDMNKLDPNTTLSDLGLDSLMAVEIKQGLERDYDVVLSTQEIRNLKIREIQELEAKVVKNKLNSGDGSSDGASRKGAKFNFKIPKDLFTPLNNVASGIPVFLWPPIEGDFDSLLPIIKTLDRPVLGVNWTLECDQHDTIEELAASNLKKMIQNHPNQDSFDIMGYSFGGLIALEVAIQLQKLMGRQAIRSLLLLDSSPAFLKSACAELVKSSQVVTEDEAHVNLLLSYVTSQIPMDNVHALRASLLSISSKEERLKKINSMLEAQLGQTIDPNQLTLAADRYYKKLKMTYFYKPNAKFSGKVISIRAKEALGKVFKGSSSDYGLEEIIDGEVETSSFSGDHKSFLGHHKEAISNILQETLSSIDL